MHNLSINNFIKNKSYQVIFLGLGLAILPNVSFAMMDTKSSKGNDTAHGVWQSCQVLKSESANQQNIKPSPSSTCYQFIKGFLHGAVLTDTQIMRGLEDNKGMSSFSQRAIRTRVGKSRATDAETYLAKFCLPDADVDHDVVVSVLNALPNELNHRQTVESEVYEAVKKAYPCEEN
ncbi:Rap1a/Tai family immunity protein [Paraglaciecola sp. 20A4]|uniref:Rap1a/Tai family immunity protein n=1 Tax=Paraglaciecola sp. 20A4 TaxID=2687288 RepID=UPI001407DFE4|nr:Rap1a/Tai family immunity protein [Paraglaciecola sp. 20A4]